MLSETLGLAGYLGNVLVLGLSEVVDPVNISPEPLWGRRVRPPDPLHQRGPGHEGGEPLVTIVGHPAVEEVNSRQGRRQEGAEHEEFVQHLDHAAAEIFGQLIDFVVRPV